MARESVKRIYTPNNSEAPCDGCQHEQKCAKGRACWDYVDFMIYGKIEVKDRRPSRTLHEKVVAGGNKTINAGLRLRIDDYDA